MEEDRSTSLFFLDGLWVIITHPVLHLCYLHTWLNVTLTSPSHNGTSFADMAGLYAHNYVNMFNYYIIDIIYNHIHFKHGCT